MVRRARNYTRSDLILVYEGLAIDTRLGWWCELDAIRNTIDLEMKIREKCLMRSELYIYFVFIRYLSVVELRVGADPDLPIFISRSNGNLDVISFCFGEGRG